MNKKYDFSLAHSDSRRDVEKYFYKYGWNRTLDKLIKSVGEITRQDSFSLEDSRVCHNYEFENYFSIVQVLQERTFPFRRDIHIVY